MIWTDAIPAADSGETTSWPALRDLKSQKDWTPWIQEVEVFAKLKGVWRYMDPDGETDLEYPTLPPEPEEGEEEEDMPDQSNYFYMYKDFKTFERERFDRDVQLHRLRSEQKHRKYIRAMKLYRSKLQSHSIALGEYNIRKNILDNLFLAMRKTVGPEFRDSIARVESPRAMIAKLQRTILPTPDDQEKEIANAEYWRKFLWQDQKSRESSPEREDDDVADAAVSVVAAPAYPIIAAAPLTTMTPGLRTGTVTPANGGGSASHFSKPSSENASGPGQKSPKRIVCPGCGKGHGMKPERWWEACWSFLAMNDVGFVPKTFNRIVKREEAIARRLKENRAEGIAAGNWVRETKKHHGHHSTARERGSNFGNSRPQTPGFREARKPEDSFNGQNLIDFAMASP